MSDEKMSSALGIRAMSDIDENEKAEQVPVVQLDVPSKEIVPINPDDDENLQDIELVRQNIASVIDIGKDAMHEMLEIAKQSEQPRAFEVVSTLMKTLLDANKEYSDISSKKKFATEEINGPKEAAQTNVTNNNLILSTADLLKMMKGENTDG
jgi:hypothetical protein|tara:strand:- start:1683 stop:2141 length:459 start_codon:yes stop_codon:yes gene_type:complete